MNVQRFKFKPYLFIFFNPQLRSCTKGKILDLHDTLYAVDFTPIPDAIQLLWRGMANVKWARQPAGCLNPSPHSLRAFDNVRAAWRPDCLCRPRRLGPEKRGGKQDLLQVPVGLFGGKAIH